MCHANADRSGQLECRRTGLSSQTRCLNGCAQRLVQLQCGESSGLTKELDYTRKFMEQIEHRQTTQTRKAYYPGAQSRYDDFLKQYPNAVVLGERTEDIVPWTVLPDVPAQEGEYALNVEAFCAVLAVTHLEDYTSEIDYLNKAIDFCNDHIWGTLSMMLFIDDRTRKSMGAAFDDAIAKLKYGSIGVNVWAGVVYGLVTPSWGAYPGHTLEDIRSVKRSRTQRTITRPSRKVCPLRTVCDETHATLVL